VHPVLLKIGSLKIYSYGVFVAIGFLAALWVAGREISRKGLDRETFFDMGFWVVIAAIAGSRLFHVLVYWEQYGANPSEIFKLWNGGLVFYGGFLAAVPVCVYFLRRHRMPFLPVAAPLPSSPRGWGSGRISCTAAGSAQEAASVPGRSSIPTRHPRPGRAPADADHRSIAAFAIFGTLLRVAGQFKTGMVFWIMIILYGVILLPRDLPRRSAGFQALLRSGSSPRS
jgi:phosphatidylglycerol:prolipoprotein diacylglycerol transferase